MTEYQPDSVSQMKTALTEACKKRSDLAELTDEDIRKFVDVLSAEQFMDNRKRAVKQLVDIVFEIAGRLDEEKRLAD